MMRLVLARLVLAGVALIVTAWLLVGLRDARMQEEGRQIVRESFRLFASSGELGGNRADLERAGRLFDSARLLNPDLSLLHDRSNQLFLLYRRRDSVDRLTELVDREPENVDAWTTLAQVAREVEPRLSARARDEARRLDPRRAERRR
jgi:predicted Zn-dependent protease